MKSIFDVNGNFFQMLSRVGDLIILNFLFLITCIPIVTIGAAWSALWRMTMDMVYEQEAGIFRGFFRAFRANFRQATVLWLIQLVVVVSLACDVLLVMTYMPGSTFMYILLGVLVFMVLAVSAYMTPLLVRYDNTLRQHMSNAVVLSVVKLPRTLGVVFLNAAPLIIAFFSLEVFLQTLVFWLFIGFAFQTYVDCTMLKKVFDELEKGNDAVTVFK